MKWVKATERIPNASERVYIRYGNNYKACGSLKTIQFFIDNGYDKVEWLDESETPSLPSGEEQKWVSEEERDEFAMSFAAWYSYAEDAQVYKSQKLSAGKMLSLYKSRPYLRTDSPEYN